MLFDIAQEFSDALALDDLTQQRSWGALARNSLAVASLLNRAGVNPGDHIAILMNNRVEYVEIVIGAIIAGVWITPINWHLTPVEIDYVLRDSGAEFIFTDLGFLPILDELAWPQRLGNDNVIVVERDYTHRISGVEADQGLLSNPAGGVMIYTSGTTGYPKGVKRATAKTKIKRKPTPTPDTSENTVDGLTDSSTEQGVRVKSAEELLRSHERLGAAVGLDGKGNHLLTGPMYHAAPLLYALYDLANGASLIIMQRWSSEMALRLIQQRTISHSHWVPTMFNRCLQLADTVRGQYDLSSLTMVLHGAEPISIQTKLAMIEWWGAHPYRILGWN